MIRAYLNYKRYVARKILYQLRNLPIWQFCLGIIFAALVIQLSLLVKLIIIILLFISLRRAYVFISIGLMLFTIVFGGWLASKQRTVEELNGKQSDTQAIVLTDMSIGEFNNNVIVKLQPSGIRARVQIPKYENVLPGELVILQDLVLEVPENFSEDFDYVTYLKSQDIWLVGKAKDIIFQKVENFLLYAGAKLRVEVKKVLSYNLNYKHVGLIAGLVIGTREDLDEDFKLNLQNTGTSHIVAVSGYNVTLLMNLLLGLAGKVNRYQLIKVCILVLVAFGFLIGWTNLPATRAVLMGLVTIFTLLIGSTNIGLLGLTYVTVGMLIYNPLVWQNVSFQLSITAFFAVIFVAPIVNKFLNSIGLVNLENLGTTLSVLVVTLPITINTFGMTSLISPLVNLVVLPIVPMLTMLSIAATLLNRVPFVNKELFMLVDLLAEILIQIINWFGSLPFSVTGNVAVGIGINILLVALFFIADIYGFKTRFGKHR